MFEESKMKNVTFFHGVSQFYEDSMCMYMGCINACILIYYDLLILYVNLVPMKMSLLKMMKKVCSKNKYNEPKLFVVFFFLK